MCKPQMRVKTEAFKLQSRVTMEHNGCNFAIKQTVGRKHACTLQDDKIGGCLSEINNEKLEVSARNKTKHNLQGTVMILITTV